MTLCARCGSPVYFAERKTSLGRDWHPTCLTCCECGKILHPGQHAEHFQKPYCHVPCYSLLFGPTTYRHGVGVTTGQESPETQKRIRGSRKGSSNCTEMFKVTYDGDKTQLNHQMGDYMLEAAAAASPPSSPSRMRCRKRLYDDQIECNIPKDISKDQLFKAIQVYNEYYTSPTSSGFIGSDKNAGQGWKFLIDYQERSGKLMLECLLKIRWGVRRYIHFMERDEVDPVIWRDSYLDRLQDSETPIMTLLKHDADKRRESLQTILNYSSKSTIVTHDNGPSRCKSPKKKTMEHAPTLTSPLPSRSTSPKHKTASNKSSKSCQSSSSCSLGQSKVSATSCQSQLRSQFIHESLKASDFQNNQNDLQFCKNLSLGKFGHEDDILDRNNMQEQDIPDFGSAEIYYTAKSFPACEDSLTGGIAESASDNSISSSIFSTAKQSMKGIYDSYVSPKSILNSPLKQESIPNSPFKHFNGGPSQDLEVESQKWLQEAERWRKKAELQESDGVTLRRSHKSRSRQPSINGHIYNSKTRVFMPEFGTVSTVRVDNTLDSLQVVQLLLNKFRIENDPRDFMLYVVKRNGETYPIPDEEFPLFNRLRLGPCHDEAQLFIMERGAVQPIPAEVAMLMCLPLAVLTKMKEDLEEKEWKEKVNIKSRVDEYKNVIIRLLREKTEV